MQKGSYLTTLLRSDKTVLTYKDIVLLWQDDSPATRVRINYYVKKGDLIRLRKGIYSKTPNYNRLELATRLFTPSYVSFETVLSKEGLIFQVYEGIFVASYLTRSVVVDNQTYYFQRMKKPILVNSSGVSQQNEVSIATKERAFLDTLHTKKEFHFDNLRSLDWQKVIEMAPLYGSKRLVKKVLKMSSEYKITDK